MTPDSTTARKFELRVLGSVELRSTDGTTVQSITAQPKRLAILTWLLLARPFGFHQRDKLLALFWPELDQERARAALSQAVYTLRRSLGAGTILTRGAADVSIAEGVIGSDVAAFEAALDIGDWKGALDLYRGDLLDGFHVTGLTGFEDWLDQERSRLREGARRAASQLSRDAEARGATAEAAQWSRRVFAFAPFDEAELRRLLTLMTASGQHAGAVTVYQDYARWLRAEMDRDPADSTKALIAKPAVQSVSTPGRVEPVGVEPAWVEPTRVETTGIDPVEVGSVDPTVTLPLRAVALLTAMLVIVVTVLWQSRDNEAAANPDHIAILPFTVRGPPDVAYLAEGMVSLLSAGLDGAGATTVVDPQALLSVVEQRGVRMLDQQEANAIATQLGAGMYVLGDIVAAGGSLQISARIYDVDGGEAGLATAIARTEADLLATVDTLARKLIGTQFRTPAQRLEKVGLLATPSFAAAKAYLVGESHYRNARYEDAFDAYRQAVALDSTFAIAHYRLATVADWVDATELISPSLDRAVRFSRRGDEHERRLIDALSFFWRARTVEADTAYASLLRAWPDDVDAWYQYGELLFHQGLYIGRPLRAAEEPFRRVIALQPDHHAALAHLMRIAAYTGRAALVDSLGMRIDAITADMRRTPEVPLMRAFVLQDTAAASRLLADAYVQPDYPVWVTAWRIAAYSGDMHGALRVIRTHMHPDRAPEFRAAAYLSAAHFEAARGRFHAADSLLSIVARVNPEDALRTRAFLATLPFSPATPALQSELRGQLSARQGPNAGRGRLRAHLGDPRLPAVLHSLLASRAGDTARARRMYEIVQDAGPAAEFNSDYANGMRAAMALATPDAAKRKDALATWTAARQSLNESPRSAGYTYAYENFLHALLLRDAGRDDEALAWFESFGNDFGYDVVFYAPAALERASIFEARGDTRSAAVEYARFVSLWKDADPALQPQVQRARERLKRPLP